ncbi:MAG: vanadium-dependent haloperoxidase [Saprospiraceae bacterium]|nr:vanadium-dependent haloperoxidase [Saprospiraceae bacterium]
MNFRFLLPIIILIYGLSWVSCNRDVPASTDDRSVKAYGNKVLFDWNELFLRIDKDALGFRPAPGPRALAYINWATYEACIPGMPEYNSLRNHPSFVAANLPVFNTKNEIYWPEVVNEVQSYLMSRMFEKVAFFSASKGSFLTNADAQRLINELKISNERDFQGKTNNVIFNNSKAWGEEIARAVWEWSKTDVVAHESYLNPLNNDPSKSKYYDWRKFSLDATGNRIPSKWTPTNDNPDGAMFPFAGEFRTFATTESQKICKAPIRYSEDPSSLYYAQNLEVLNRSYTNVTYEDAWIGEFWSDDLFGLTFSPPSRLLACLDQIMILDNSKLDKAIYATALLSLSMNDFAVVCWNSKFHYNFERPEHYIKDVLKVTNYESALDHPYTGIEGITPAFPAYPSGHSTFGGGGFFAIAAVYGDHFTFTDRCHQGRTEFVGTPRTYSNLSDAGFEDAMSRIPLGVHVRQDCEEGLRLGKEIAARMVALPWKK